MFKGKYEYVMVCCTPEHIPFDRGVGRVLGKPTGSGWYKVQWSDGTESEVHGRYLMEIG